MDPADGPPKLKETPTIKPALLPEWQRLYEELSKSYLKSRALQIIGDRYGVSRQTVMYHVFPSYKSEKIKKDSRQWYFRKKDPAFRKKIINYKLKYVSARRHIADLVNESYCRALPQEVLTIENLRDAIYKISGIAFWPSTLDGLIKRYEQAKGVPLLVEISGDAVPHYTLHKQSRK